MLVVMSIPDEQLPTSDEVRRLFFAHLRYVSSAEYLDAFEIFPYCDDLPLEKLCDMLPDNDTQVVMYSHIVDHLIPETEISCPGSGSSVVRYYPNHYDLE